MGTMGCLGLPGACHWPSDQLLRELPLLGRLSIRRFIKASHEIAGLRHPKLKFTPLLPRVVGAVGYPLPKTRRTPNISPALLELGSGHL